MPMGSCYKLVSVYLWQMKVGFEDLGSIPDATTTSLWPWASLEVVLRAQTLKPVCLGKTPAGQPAHR